MNPRKLLRHALQSPANLRFSEALQLAAAFGFHHVRTSGSHHILSRPGVPTLVNLQNVGGKAKAYQIRQLLKLVEKHNLMLEGTEL
jgi:predicted RNA binding protein YcfA (HicA-like mRNA interferase family)